MFQDLSKTNSIKGAAFIEFALIFPIFASVLFTTIQLSLIFIDKASINYVTEELLLDVATGELLPMVDINGKLIEADQLKIKWENILNNFQVHTTEVSPEILPFTARICIPRQTSLRNFDDDNIASKFPKENVLLTFTVNVKINCTIGALTFGLTDFLCIHNKEYFRIMTLEPKNYHDCPLSK